MSNAEKKQKVWDEIYPTISHLEQYFKIETQRIDDQSQYFHPEFILDENFKIRCQCDIGNIYMYAIRCMYTQGEIDIELEIDSSLFENVVIGYHLNKEATMYALNTISKIRTHIGNLRDYCDEYVRGVLMGDAMDAISMNFINEIKNTTEVIKHMKSKIKAQL